MGSLLFLAPSDLGETVLASGAVDYALAEGGALTIVCQPAAACLFRAVPQLAATMTLPAQTSLGQRWSLWRRLAGRRFDLVLDARGGLLGQAAPGARRISLKPAPAVRHRAEDWAEALGAPRPLPPKLWIDAPARAAAANVLEAGPVIALAPGGALAAKRWAPERFAAIARRLASGPLPEAQVVIVGAGERDGAIARAIVSSLDADGVRARDLTSGLDLLAGAALMERATLALGNDNALTHLAAAAGAPALTLFGPTDERVRAPSGPRARTLRAAPLAHYAALDETASMHDVSIDMVEAACLDLLRAGGLA